MPHPQPIAIVGVGGRFPSATTLADYWRIIAEARCVAREVPADRWPLPAQDYYDARVGTEDRVYSLRGCFLDEFTPNLSGLDFDPAWLAQLDPLFSLTLDVGRQAFLNVKSHERLDRVRTGVILANLILPTETASSITREVLGGALRRKLGPLTRSPSRAHVAPINRHAAGLPAGLLAKALRLGLGAFTLDAACASSLYAIKLACEELRAGRADAMLAGGVSRPDCLFTQMGFSQLRALSPSGWPRPFDERADGLVVGEGAGIFVLKRLETALREGDTIHGVLHGIGLSNDTGGSLLAPDSEGQLRAMREAYAQTGWRPGDVDYVECHATGTQRGDATELSSLTSLWVGESAPRGCPLGSAKSNVGHLLTAAGSAGLMKVLLSFRNATLTPTANFERSQFNFDTSPFRVLTQAEPWPRRDDSTPRRAAVSAFGFGGINAHLLVEEWLGAPNQSYAVRIPPPAVGPALIEPIAIVGMDARFGSLQSLREFQEAVFTGRPAFQPPRASRWLGLESGEEPASTGAFLGDLRIAIDRFRISPNELQAMLPQQVVMLLAADGALNDAALAGRDGNRTGVFMGIGLDFNSANFHLRWTASAEAESWAQELKVNLADEPARRRWLESIRDAVTPVLTADRTIGALGGMVASRLAREFHVGGPSFTIQGEENSGLHALEVGLRALQRGELEVALVGAVDIGGDLRSVLTQHELRPLSPTGARPFDATADGTTVGEGAVCLVLKRLSDAQRDGDRVYAVVKGIGFATGGHPNQATTDVSAYSRTLETAYAEAEVDPSTVSYFEAHGSGSPDEDALEAQALDTFFGSHAPRAPVTLGSVKAVIGHTGPAAGLASVAKAALCLHHEVLPPLPPSRIRSELSLATRFDFPAHPMYWYRNRAEGPRRAGVSCLGSDGNVGHVVLEGLDEISAGAAIRTQPLVARDEGLFIVEADDEHGVLAELTALAQWLGAAEFANVEGLARAWWRQRRAQPERKLAAALVARDADELQEQLALVRSWIETSEERRATDRVFFSPRPLGRTGQLAFVFPGSGNRYDGMGHRLSAEWPELLRELDTTNQLLRSQFAPRPNLDDHRSLIFGHVSHGMLLSDLLQRCGVKPQAVLGYSLGESAGYIAMRVWPDHDDMVGRMNDSPLFGHELVGACQAARRAWQLRDNEAVEWQVGVVDCPAERVRAALVGRARAYLLIVNTPTECVIGGQRAAVEALVRELDCLFLPLKNVPTVHCDIAREVRAAYHALHVFECRPPAGIRFYSGAWGRDFEVTPESCADSILAGALDGIDFPRVVGQAYDDGVRLFVEVGPRNSCTRMIARILGNRPHVARSACVQGSDPVSSVLRVLGHLIAERVPVDLTWLYGTETQCLGHRPPQAPPQRAIVVPIGGQATIPAVARKVETTSTSTGKHKDAKIRRPPGQPASQPATVASPLIAGLVSAHSATAAAHDRFLQISARSTEAQLGVLQFQQQLLAGVDVLDLQRVAIGATESERPIFLNRAQCEEFARGSLAKVLGPMFAEVDSYPTRVRLPDGPLNYVDRMIEVEGAMGQLGAGRLVTEHDLLPNAWYLDGAVMPAGQAVEAGQADLFLAGYLGIDLRTKGIAKYRLLDAVVSFHHDAPRAGQTLRYDIRIEKFLRQGDTYLFFFNFDGFVDGQPLMTMRAGCAGFFTDQQLAEGRGLVFTDEDRQPCPGVRTADWRGMVPMQVESFNEAKLAALREGDLAGAFGPAFAGLTVATPLTIPAGQMTLIDRVTMLDPTGGRYGLGLVRAEIDLAPDDWFLTCHFVDDPVMPGTLMYDSCLHALRVFLLRMGWVGEAAACAWEPVPGVGSQLRCRGQVIPGVQRAVYELSIKELGYRPEPYAIADALMSADGRDIVLVRDMTLRLTGTSREQLEALWSQAPTVTVGDERKPAVYPYDRILACAIGDCEFAFGDRYRGYGRDHFLARLPGPPYLFMSRVTEVQGAPWVMQAGASAEAQYEVPPDAWYFRANRQRTMPFSVALEFPLQVCGWLAAYCGSALTSNQALHFRNLDGDAVMYAELGPDAGTLSARVALTSVSQSAGMVIQKYTLLMTRQGRTVFEGTTAFGFFSEAALSQQVGVRGAQPYLATADQRVRGRSFALPDAAPFRPDDSSGEIIDGLALPSVAYRMADQVELFVPDGGPHGLGFIRGTKAVNPDEWFFTAHFHQDPVWPGSLGLESFLQLLKVVAIERWGATIGATHRFQPIALGVRHQWMYRGQIVRLNQLVAVEAVITEVDDTHHLIKANGFLSVDGKVIYQMTDFSIRAVPV